MSIIPHGVFFNRRSHFGRGPFSVELPEPFLQDEHHGHAVMVPPPLLEAVPARIEWKEKETPEAHVYEANLPGLNKHEVKVEIEDGRMLCISGEKKVEKKEKTDKWHRVQRGTSKFVRRFRLPENVKVEKMRAFMENGVLIVTVPKDHEAVKHHSRRAIPIEGK